MRVLRAAASGHMYCLTVHGSAAGFVDLQGDHPSYPRSEWVFSALCLGWIARSEQGPRIVPTEAGQRVLARLEDATAARPFHTLSEGARSLDRGAAESIC
ncbi:hypothetical protein [Streptomyces sp. NBC_01601]|uniref:hypothetical protein n=1 Tax=Streptomyces sp. NBC_01601 TaxID=2975892 RepID=UPI002E2D0993|nr:hypothetical protein [Streptomyces sp. NBC_01601]